MPNLNAHRNPFPSPITQFFSEIFVEIKTAQKRLCEKDVLWFIDKPRPLWTLKRLRILILISISSYFLSSIFETRFLLFSEIIFENWGRTASQIWFRVKNLYQSRIWETIAAQTWPGPKLQSLSTNQLQVK